MKFARPMDRLTQYSSNSSRASASPASTASQIILASRWPAFFCRLLLRPSASARSANLTKDAAEVYASRQPLRPQPHCSPSRWMTMWPISPAMPLLPVYSLPSMMMPPPTPVPSVTMTMLRAPFAEPAVASPSAAQLASLSSCTAQPNSGRNASAKQTLFMPRLVPNLSVQVALSNEPGTPMPMLVMLSGAIPRSPHSASASSFISASPVRVGVLRLLSSVPSSSHSAALTDVPPRSIPILMLLPPSIMSQKYAGPARGNTHPDAPGCC